MGFIQKLQRKRLERKFKKNNLSIIQHISKDAFHNIIEVLHGRGWEVSLDYYGPDGWDDKGKCLVRKGSSVLDFVWSKEDEGSITGLNRIVSGVANEFNLLNRSMPI